VALDLSIVGQPRKLGQHRWSRSDTMLYALAIGCGPDDLRFVTEGSARVPAEVFPTFSTIVERRRSYSELGDIKLSQLLHAGQTSSLHAPVPTERERDPFADNCVHHKKLAADRSLSTDTPRAEFIAAREPPVSCRG